MGVFETNGMGCPKSYRETTICQASPLVDKATSKALGRLVIVPRDCETGNTLPAQRMPPEVRNGIDFDDFFNRVISKNPRFFGAKMAWNGQKVAPANGGPLPADSYDDDDKYAEFNDFQKDYVNATLSAAVKVNDVDSTEKEDDIADDIAVVATTIVSNSETDVETTVYSATATFGITPVVSADVSAPTESTE